MTTDTLFTETLNHYRQRVEKTLKIAITSKKETPDILREAMLYTTLNGGKRLRPTLVYAMGNAFNQSTPLSLDNIAAAIECIHCYSLIHDDLPAMDDDKLRRNKPTCHIVFGEAIAILTGDALQTLAFDLLSASQNTVSTENQVKIIQILAHHAGCAGMAGGQALDVLAENKSLAKNNVEHIHSLKTGALIRASVIMGALGAGCHDSAVINQLDAFATRLGIAFQLQDDLLDVTGNSKNLGKTAGKDSKQHKSTYISSQGIDATKARIHTITDEAKQILLSLPIATAFLTQLCDVLVGRAS